MGGHIEARQINSSCKFVVNRKGFMFHFELTSGIARLYCGIADIPVRLSKIRPMPRATDTTDTPE